MQRDDDPQHQGCLVVDVEQLLYVAPLLRFSWGKMDAGTRLFAQLNDGTVDFGEQVGHWNGRYRVRLFRIIEVLPPFWPKLNNGSKQEITGE